MGGVVDSIRSTLSETACCRTNTSTELPKERRTSTGAIRILTRPWAWDSTAESLRKVVLFYKNNCIQKATEVIFFRSRIRRCWPVCQLCFYRFRRQHCNGIGSFMPCSWLAINNLFWLFAPGGGPELHAWPILGTSRRWSGSRAVEWGQLSVQMSSSPRFAAAHTA